MQLTPEPDLQGTASSRSTFNIGLKKVEKEKEKKKECLFLVVASM